MRRLLNFPGLNHGREARCSISLVTEDRYNCRLRSSVRCQTAIGAFIGYHGQKRI
jgi:hypothetical protein